VRNMSCRSIHADPFSSIASFCVTFTVHRGLVPVTESLPQIDESNDHILNELLSDERYLCKIDLTGGRGMPLSRAGRTRARGRGRNREGGSLDLQSQKEVYN
jgi:hypothetical protein